MARDESEKNSWLERWWNSIAYLGYRDCVPINSNFAMVFVEPPRIACPVRRAALLAKAMFEFKTLVDNRTLPPDPQPADQLPYTLLFGACRVPAPECDIQRRFDELESRHVVVVYRDSFWVVEGAQDASVAQLEEAFRSVRALGVDCAGTSTRVGVLTFSHRDAWASCYPLLQSQGQNASILDKIHSAAFVLCFDDAKPSTLDERFDLIFHGDATSCSNRWFDKPLQLIVFANGAAGLNGEHSPVDGGPVARLMDWVGDREQVLQSEMAPASSSLRGLQLQVHELAFSLTDELREHIRMAHVFAVKQMTGVLVHQLRFAGFGKGLITKFKVSPDAWCQAALQLAYYRLHGRFAPTYESASTRQYLAGRTETGRTLTPELAHFIRSFEAGRAGQPELQSLFQDSCKAHVAYLREAVAGHGVDRHMLAFRLLAKEAGVSHPFLSDPLVSGSSYWRLSTSQLAVDHICIGFGPVVPDGYGICYQVHKNHLHFSVSSFKNDHGTNCFALSDEISKALNDLRLLFPITPSSL